MPVKPIGPVWAGGAAENGEGDGAELIEGKEGQRKEPEFDIDFAEEDDEESVKSRDSGFEESYAGAQ